MKRNLTLFLIALSVASLAVVATALAEESTTPGKIKRPLLPVRAEMKTLEKVENRVNALKEKLESKRENLLEKVRNSVVVRIDVYQKLIGRSEDLINKLQSRVDTAKTAGKDVKDAEVVLADAKLKLADAKTKLSEIEALKIKVAEVKNSSASAQVISLDKQNFKEIQTKFQIIHKDLNAIRLDVAKVIRILGKFNSRNESTKSATTSSFVR